MNLQKFEDINIKMVLEHQRIIREHAHANKELGFNIPLEEFINIMRLLPPQNYGTRIQNRVIKNLNFIKVKSSENKGDCLDNFGDNYEIKTSIIDVVNVDLNVVNVRKWQNVHYYIIGFDVRKDFKCYFFRLSARDMERELDLMSATSSLGTTTTSNKDNLNVERRFSVRIDSDDFVRWCETYLSNASDYI